VRAQVGPARLKRVIFYAILLALFTTCAIYEATRWAPGVPCSARARRAAVVDARLYRPRSDDQYAHHLRNSVASQLVRGRPSAARGGYTAAMRLHPQVFATPPGNPPPPNFASIDSVDEFWEWSKRRVRTLRLMAMSPCDALCDLAVAV
jgi:hypothetical protein